MNDIVSQALQWAKDETELRARAAKAGRQRLTDWALRWFDRWFTSAGGVWQTLLIVLGIVAVETFFPRVDPHMFLLMAWLTIYSAVTQPALAHANAEQSEQIVGLEQQILQLEDRLINLLTTSEDPGRKPDPGTTTVPHV